MSCYIWINVPDKLLLHRILPLLWCLCLFWIFLFLPTGLILNIKLLKAVHVSKYFDDQFYWEVSFQIISDCWGEFILHLDEELHVFELKYGGKRFIVRLYLNERKNKWVKSSLKSAFPLVFLIQVFLFTVPPLVCWILSGGSQLTHRSKIRFSSLSPEKLSSSGGFREH